MTLYFITGNENKFAEASAYLPNLERIQLDLPELQELNSRAIIEAKLRAAREHSTEDLLIDDVGLHLDCLNGFPGPLIKWFLQTQKCEGIYRIAQLHNNYGVEAVCTLGYAKGDQIEYFEGRVRGTIVEPKGEIKKGWWDTIFVPHGATRRFSEMTTEEKNAISHRGQALAQLQSYIKKHT